MFAQFQKFIEKEGLIDSDQKVLLAVSGGVDSMVMLDLFRKSDYDFEVAHCNFQLRNAESDADQQLVRRYCLDFKIEFHTIEFDTNKLIEERKMGIQELARELRYQWFEKIMSESGCEILATAHHKEDSVETMLFNFSRGTGVSGLKGIEPKRDSIIRPILFAEKKDILDYAMTNGVPFREDSSNADTKYNRNKIRHRIIPELKEVNASLINTLYEKSKVFREGADLIEKTIKAELAKVLIHEGESMKIPLSYLMKSSYKRLLLWSWLEKYDFSSTVMEQVLKLLDSHPGKKISNSKYSIYRDRKYLVLIPNKSKEDRVVVYNTLEELINEPEWNVSTDKSDHVKIEKDKSMLYLDLDKIHFPMIRRVWQAGDKFVPFGRTKKIKVKEFLTHEKVPAHVKSNIEVLESAGSIIWLIGVRASAKFNVSNKTEMVLKIAIKNS